MFSEWICSGLFKYFVPNSSNKPKSKAPMPVVSKRISLKAKPQLRVTMIKVLARHPAQVYRRTRTLIRMLIHSSARHESCQSLGDTRREPACSPPSKNFKCIGTNWAAFYVIWVHGLGRIFLRYSDSTIVEIKTLELGHKRDKGYLSSSLKEKLLLYSRNQYCHVC